LQSQLRCFAAAANDLDESRIVRQGPVRSYTNDVARTAKTCQASDEAKTVLAE